MFRGKILAENIRKQRTSKGISQTDLARMLNIRPQSISKWERNIAMPDIENLCLLSQALNISVDQLLGNALHQEKLLIGIDGGGSKTEFILFRDDGTLIDRCVLGSCNPNAIGLENCASLLTQGINTLVAAPEDVCGIYIGASGFATGGNGKKIHTMLSQIYRNAKIRCETDIMNVIAAADLEQKCIAVICGTGSVVYAKEANNMTKLTGWGYLLSTNGSGYDIGRDVLRRALSEAEGLADSSLISSLVETKLGAPVSQCVQEVYKHDPAYIASFAPLAFDAYAQGDHAAAQILEDNAESLAAVINHAASHYDCGNHVVLSGGLVTDNHTFRKMFTERLLSDLTVSVPNIPQVLAACRLCAELCGIDSHAFLEKLVLQYQEKR